MREPRDIIGHDAYMQLAFEGYKVVPARTVAGFPVVEDPGVAPGVVQFRDANGKVVMTVFGVEV